MYQGIRKVHDARAAAAQDPTMTEQAQLVRTQDMADRVFKQAAGALDKAHANMKSGIALMETQLSTPVSTEAAGTYGKEIRAYVRVWTSGRAPAPWTSDRGRPPWASCSPPSKVVTT